MQLSLFIKFIFNNNREVIYLINTPTHGNIGDQAITLAELGYLKRNFYKSKVIEINELEWTFHKLYILGRIQRDALILIHGGGYLGTLWREQSDRVFEIMRSFPDNNKIILPQTAYYENELAVQEDKKELSQIKNLWICARDKNTYDILINKLGVPLDRLLLVPDIVTTYRWSLTKHNCKANEALVVFRNDHEKVMDLDLINKVKKYLDEKKVCYKQIDMCERFFVFPLRGFFVKKKLRLFSKARFVVTDRLHGVYFSAITNTSCLAFDNVSGKVRGGCEWLKGKSNITPVAALEEFIIRENDESFEQNTVHDFLFYEEKFDDLKTLIHHLL